MISKAFFASLCLLSVTILASAQNKISGSAQCTKPDIQQKVEIPDHPGHTLSLSQFKCTWTKPMEIEGVQDKEGLDTDIAEAHGSSGNSHGYYVDNFSNGDKIFTSWQGSDSLTAGSAEGKWHYTGGTGKFKGIKGSGTYKGKYTQDGTVTFDVEGEYTLAK